MWRLAIVVALFFWLAACLNLRTEWSLNEQYTYGWAVPLLCLFLFWRRWNSSGSTDAPPATPGLSQSSIPNPPVSAPTFQRSTFNAQLICFLLVLFFTATRLIEEANPDWRLVGWMLATEAVSFSLLLLYLGRGFSAVRQFAFPICFFLVAVSWPTLVEHPVIQSLTRANVSITVEVLNWFGMAALQHGNVIETVGGLVDIDTACSGIRSLQASLMLALFFGELRRLHLNRRLVLCGLSIAFALFFNATRTILLAVITAQRGSVVMMRWHDPAGSVILVACFVGVWAAAAWLGRRPAPSRLERGIKDQVSMQFAERNNLSKTFIVSFIALILLGEVAVQAWYHSAAPVSALGWNVALPQQNLTLRSNELPAETIRLLRFTEAKSGKWQNADGTQWQFSYFRWAPGRTAVNLARNHTPDICLPAAGHKLTTLNEIEHVTLDNITISFRSFVTGTSERPMFVFYSLWEDGASEQSSEAQILTVRRRLKAVLARHRNPGQRVIEIAISGARDLAQAEASLRDELPKLIHIQPH